MSLVQSSVSHGSLFTLYLGRLPRRRLFIEIVVLVLPYQRNLAGHNEVPRCPDLTQIRRVVIPWSTEFPDLIMTYREVMRFLQSTCISGFIYPGRSYLCCLAVYAMRYINSYEMLCTDLALFWFTHMFWYTQDWCLCWFTVCLLFEHMRAPKLV